jgi:hypothetical protein
MSHEIHLPHHGDITAPLSTALDAARSLPTDDARATARQIVIALAADGVGTVGEALEVLEHSSPAERRAMLDDARRGAGLPDTARVDRRRASGRADRRRARSRRSRLRVPELRDLRGSASRAGHRCPDADTRAPLALRGAPGPGRATRHGALDERAALRCRRRPGGRERRRGGSPRPTSGSGTAPTPHERRRAAAAALPGIERQAAIEAASWRGANLMPEPEITA